MKDLSLYDIFTVCGGACEKIETPNIILLNCNNLANQHDDMALAIQLLVETGKSVKVTWKEDSPSGHSQLVWSINK